MLKIANIYTLGSFRTPQCVFPTFTGGSADFPGGSNPPKPPDKFSPAVEVGQTTYPADTGSVDLLSRECFPEDDTFIHGFA